MCNNEKTIGRLLSACDKLKEVAGKSNEISFPSSSIYSSVPSDDIKERLFTYTSKNWKIKPKEVSIRALAKHGWSCIGEDILQCVNCKQYMNVSFPSLDKLNVFENTIRKISKQMIEGHQSTCAMRNVISKCSTILSAPSIVYRQKIQVRYDTLLALNLNGVKLKLFDKENTSRLSALCLDNLNAAVLACLGWHKKSSVDDTIMCDYCERSIGLWLFREKKELNGETEHCRWCAYVEMSEENGSVAWERHLAAAVEPMSRKRKLSTTVELREKTNLIDNLISDHIMKRGRVSGID
uniref:C3HC-type domain-containing protein n=1 Tax=Syphacia muris TaxID=451379 RepID=A0A158R657_9BILA